MYSMPHKICNQVQSLGPIHKKVVAEFFVLESSPRIFTKESSRWILCKRKQSLDSRPPKICNQVQSLGSIYKKVVAEFFALESRHQNLCKRNQSLDFLYKKVVTGFNATKNLQPSAIVLFISKESSDRIICKRKQSLDSIKSKQYRIPFHQKFATKCNHWGHFTKKQSLDSLRKIVVARIFAK